MRSWLKRLSCAALCLALWSCGPRVTDEGGSATETVAFRGTVEYPDGRVAAGVRVTVRRIDFLKDTSQVARELYKLSPDAIDTVTDSLGWFVLDSLDSGTYRIELNDDQGFAKLLDTEVTTQQSDTFALSVLESAGSFEGTINVQSLGAVEPVYVQIYGMDRVTEVDSLSGGYQFHNMPPGAYAVRALPKNPAIPPMDSVNIQIVSGDTVSAGHVLLTENGGTRLDSLIVQINTTPTGADITENVVQFPMLVRLTGETFDFPGTGPGSVLFRDSKGNVLPHQVERWDLAAQRGEVWVLMDTVYANADSQKIVMYFGDSLSDTGYGHDVFQLNNGFAAVWHLGETAPDTGSVDVYRNSVEDANHGEDYISATNITGMIGRGSFMDWGDHIRVREATDRLKPSDSLTVSLWVFSDTTDSQASALASMGDDYGIHLMSSDSGLRAFVFDTSTVDYNVTSPGIFDGNWHHGALVLADTLLRVYLDGELAGEVSYPLETIQYNLGSDFLMGQHGTFKEEFNFQGFLDEVRVSRVVRSLSWIKLEYESQRILTNTVTIIHR